MIRIDVKVTPEQYKVIEARKLELERETLRGVSLGEVMVIETMKALENPKLAYVPRQKPGPKPGKAKALQHA